jgi:hypothetical protein
MIRHLPHERWVWNNEAFQQRLSDWFQHVSGWTDMRCASNLNDNHCGQHAHNNHCQEQLK